MTARLTPAMVAALRLLSGGSVKLGTVQGLVRAGMYALRLAESVDGFLVITDAGRDALAAIDAEHVK